MPWEYKLTLRDDRMAKPLFSLLESLDHIAGYPARLGARTVYKDSYFDTLDMRLEAQGLICRHQASQGREWSVLADFQIDRNRP